MSVTSKITLGISCGITTCIVGYVHYKQMSDRDKLHDGVIRDIERQQRRKIENLYNLQQQNDLAKQLQKELDLRTKAEQTPA